MPRANHPVWYRSLYWRVGLGFVAFLAVLLVAQALLFAWLTGRAAGAFPAASGARLAELIAGDIRARLETDPDVDLAAHVAQEYGRVVQPFVIVMADGRALTNRVNAPPGLLRNTQARLSMLNSDRLLRPRQRRALRPPANGRAEAPIILDDRIVGLVAVPPGRVAPMAALQQFGPTLALSGIGLLVLGAGAAALLIFGPVRRRLREVQEAAARIGAGEVTARASDAGRDEVAALAHAFNQMAADLQARAIALTASDLARRQLLADVSHELMTPLTAMRGYLETLAMAELRLDPPTRERYLRIVDDETRRLERIIGDLLDLARLEGGGTVLRREFVDTAALFDRVAERHARELTDRRVALRRSIEVSAERVMGDPDRLEQALQNLAANALRHTPDGGTISLSAARSGDTITITVRDNGPGIPPEHLSLIFDRFYKADAARATAGSGLGLSIVKAIIARHGGTIRVRNDGGAVFEIMLPVVPSTDVGSGSGPHS
jgi:signal transduction histidine kinase